MDIKQNFAGIIGKPQTAAGSSAKALPDRRRGFVFGAAALFDWVAACRRQPGGGPGRTGTVHRAFGGGNRPSMASAAMAEAFFRAWV